MTPESLFQQLHGQVELVNAPCIDTQVYQTSRGTSYLQSPGVVMLSYPKVNVGGLEGFLGGFDESLDFPDYLLDPALLPTGSYLCKIAGQLCYMSFGPKRTKNADAQRYFDNIKSSQHGSVLEHANYSFLLYGISRSVTHELVRHRAGFAFSQVSQRYVSGKVLRFVERPEYQHNSVLHTAFERRVEKVAEEYEVLTNALLLMQKSGEQILSADEKTDLRKKVQQAARSVLTNETEAPIVVTGNARAWRHFIEMRASSHAEIEIRELALRIFLCLYQVDNILFGDYELEQLSDGTYTVKTEYRKV